MPFRKLTKPIGHEKDDSEAYHSVECAINSPEGEVFRMEIMCITRKAFEPNAIIIMEEVSNAISALLSKTNGLSCN